MKILAPLLAISGLFFICPEILAQVTRFSINGQNITANQVVNACINTPVIFENTSGGNVTAQSWAFENGNPATGTTTPITVRFNKLDSAKVTLIVTRGGQKDTISAYVKVMANNVDADFNFTPTAQCANTPVRFTNASTPGGLTYAWNFDDPNSNAQNASTQANPTHRFVGNPGNNNQEFDVRLIATNNIGCRDTVTKKANVKKLPGTQLGGSNPTSYEGKTTFRVCTSNPNGDVTLINQSSTSATNTGYKITWGNGAPDFANAGFGTPLVQNYLVGIYDLTYIVDGGNGCSDTAVYGVFVGSNPAVGLGNPGNTSICTGSSLTFPISNTAANPPGTVYEVIFNDGSNKVQFDHPAPASVTHVFDVTSCGTTSGEYPNSFSATIKATNPCLSSQANVVPIYVSEKSRAIIGIAPRDTVCTGQQVTINDNSGNISFINGTTCSDGNRVWTISPSTGYSISGTPGNDYGLSDPTLWSKGSAALFINFTQPGTYSIKLKVGNPVCGRDSVVRSICVNPAPVAAFTVSRSTGCAPLTIQTKNNSNTPVCDTNTYEWTVAYSAHAGCNPSQSSYDLLNGTTLHSAEPDFRFNNPGVYTLTLVTRNSFGICVSAPVSHSVTVNEKPNAGFSAPSALCQFSSISPVPTFNNCGATQAATFAWDFPGGLPRTSIAQNPGSVILDTTGSIVLTLTITNECGATVVTRPLTVNPTPIVTVPPNQEICRGQQAGPYTFTTLPAAGATVKWAQDNLVIGLPLSGTGNINSFTPASSGLAVFTVTPVIGSCTGGAKNFSLNVLPLPAAPLTNPTIQYCVGDAANQLSATPLAGHTINWYSGSSGGSPIPAPTPSTALAGTTTWWVSQINNTTQCEGPRAPVTVTVHPIPSIGGSSFINPSTCAASNGSITLTGLAANQSYTVSFSQNGSPVSINLTSNGSGSILISNLPAGIYNNIRVSGAGCPSAAIGPISLSDPNPPMAPTVTGPDSLCTGSLLSLSAATSTPGAVIYTWSGPNNFTSSQQSPSISNIGLPAGGTYSVTARLGNCTSAAGTLKLVVSPTPAMNAASNSPVCSGATVFFTANSSTPGAVQYNWSGPNGFSSTLQNPSINNALTGDGGTYTLTGTLGPCTAAPVQVNLLVRPTPVLDTAIGTNPTTCATSTGSIQLWGLMAGSQYQVTYTKDGVPQSVSLTAQSNGTITISGLGAGVYDNIRVSLAGCQSGPANRVALSDPNPPATPIAGSNTPVCTGNSLQLSATTTTPGAVQYKWSGPNGFSSTQQNPTILGISLGAGGNYSVTATLAGCTSAAGTVQVAVLQTPVVNATSNSPVCSGESLLLGATSLPAGNTGYQWTGPNGFSSTAQNPVLPQATVNQGGNYQVQSTLQGCTSAPANVLAVVRPTPVIASVDTLHPTSCTMANGSLVLHGLSPFTAYQVSYVRDGARVNVGITSNGAGRLTISGLGAGNYSDMTVTLNQCSSLPLGPIDLVVPNPPPAPIVTGNGPLCIGSTILLTAIGSGSNGSYQWTGPNGFSSTLQNPSIAHAGVAHSGDYSATFTVNGCVSAPARVTVLVSQQATAPSAGPDQELCNAVKTTLAANNPANGTGAWTVVSGGGAIVTLPGQPNSELTNLPLGTTQLVWTVTNNVCPEASDTMVIMNLPAIAQSLQPLQTTICLGQSVGLSGNLPTGGNQSYSYQWQESNNNTSFTDIDGATGATYLASPAAQTWYRRIVVSGACMDAGDTAMILVRPALANNILSGAAEICTDTEAPAIVGSLPTGGEGNYQFTWEKSADGGRTWQIIAGENNQSLNPGILTQTTQFRRVVSTSLCLGPQSLASNIHTIVVRPDAQLVWNPTGQTGCTPLNVDSSLLGIQHLPGKNSLYRWYADQTSLGSGLVFPGHTIANAGDSVTIKVVAVSAFGCKNDSSEVVYRTIGNPAPGFTLSDSVGCGPITIGFTNNTPQLNGFSYHWDFGNGETSGLAQPAPVVFARNPDFGDTLYTVTLYASNGCDTLAYRQTIRVRAPAKSIISPDRAEGCSPARFTFTNNSRGSGASFTWDFGDGSPLLASQDDTVRHTYSTGARQFFTVKLISENSCGRDTGRFTLLVLPNPIKLTLLTDAHQLNGCSPHTVRFINNTLGANQFRYDFGDGSAIVSTNRQFDTLYHTYLQPGKYNMQVEAIGGCNDTVAYRTITVDTAPVAGFTQNKTLVCLGESIQFTNQSTPGATTQWSFGDGSGSGDQNPLKSFSAPGAYRITLYASTNFGPGFTCTDSASANIIVRDTLQGNFTIDSSGSCAPFFTTFKTTLPNAAQTYWYFGDGATATGDSVVHAYRAAGQYQVTMVSLDAGGCAFKALKTITVRGPSGQLRFAAPFACVGRQVNFAVQTGNTSRFVFYPGNGDSVVTSNSSINYRYLNSGSYLPRVALISGACRSELTGGDSLKVDEVQAGFRQIGTVGCANSVFQFTDTGSALYGKGTWYWQFGDGTTANSQTTSKTYTIPGVYRVSLRLTGLSGCSDSVTLPIRVDIEKVPQGQVVGDTVACIGQTLNFQALVQNADGPVQQSWLFGNGQQADGQRVSTSYPQGGHFSVKLITQSGFGCRDTVDWPVRISPDPLVNAGPNLMVCRGTSRQLAVTGGVRYAWTPSQGLSCADCPNPVARPLENTEYIVTGFNALGCQASDTLEIEVPQPFTLSFSNNDTICLGETKQLNAGGAQRYHWTPATGLNSATIPNPIASPTITTTYQVIGRDFAGCFADTGWVTVEVGRIPTVDIGTGGQYTAGTRLNLRPRLGNGPFARYDWTPETGLSCTDCPTPILTVTSDLTYSLTVTSPLGCAASDTIQIRAVCVQSEQVYLPNAFSPDGDGVNDVFMVRGKGLARVKSFRVFNRTGQVVFERTNIDANDPVNGWDGKYRGVPASPDVYVYTVELLCTGGATYFVKGNVTLFR